MSKSKYPSKKEIIAILLKENPKQKGMDKLILLIEHKKINANVGIIKGEILKDRKVLVTGSMTCIPKKSADSFDWTILDNRESFFDEFSVDYGKETIGSMIKEGLKKNIKEGKIPFFQK